MLKTDALMLLLILALLAVPLWSQSGVTKPANVIYVANEAGTGTVQGKLVKLTGAPSTAIVAGIADTSGVVGICVNNCGTTGTATIQVWGQVNCVFDSATTAGDYVQIDTSTVGDCMDSGAGTPPAAGQSMGRVLSTHGGAGTYEIDLFPADIQAGGGAGGHVIQEEGVPLLAEPDLNFTGAGVTCSDDPGNTATVCNVPGTPGAANYSKPFVAAASLTITNAEHTFGHASLLVNCYDNSAPPRLFEPALITVNAATFQVDVTFAGNTTGYCVVNGGSGSSTAIPQWRKYALVAIANGVNGCANANGCWQVNGVLGANKAAGFTQDVVLVALGAGWQLTDWRIKTNTACTGTTTALSGLGTTGNNVLFRPQTYDIAPAAADTNLSTGPTAGAGADTAAVTNLVASLITTVDNIDQLVAGCAVDYWAMWGTLP